MATNPNDSTTPEAEQPEAEQPEQLDAVPTEQLDALRDRLGIQAPEPEADAPAGVVIDANGTAWEDTEATRNERAAS